MWSRKLSQQANTNYKVFTGADMNKGENKGVLLIENVPEQYTVQWRKKYMCARGASHVLKSCVLQEKILVMLPVAG